MIIIEPTALQLLLTDLSAVVTSAIAWMGSIASAVASNPIILIPFAIGIIGFGAGLFLRLARPN